jgi:hypothetical protein
MFHACPHRLLSVNEINSSKRGDGGGRVTATAVRAKKIQSRLPILYRFHTGYEIISNKLITEM